MDMLLYTDFVNTVVIVITAITVKFVILIIFVILVCCNMVILVVMVCHLYDTYWKTVLKCAYCIRYSEFPEPFLSKSIEKGSFLCFCSPVLHPLCWRRKSTYGIK